MSKQPGQCRILYFEQAPNSRRSSAGRKENGSFIESYAGRETKARCLVVPEEEALRMQWLNDRVDSVTGYYHDYLRSLHCKYRLSEQDWEFDIHRGQFVRKQMA